MTVTLAEIRTEHEDLGIGSRLQSLLEQVVRATAPTYPASEYSPSGVWTSETLQDLLQEWVAVRLVGRKDLQVLVHSASTIKSLRGSLTTSLSQFLINGRRRSSALNLFKRAALLLEHDDRFLEVTKGGKQADRLWRARSGSEQRTTRSLGALVKLASQKTDADLEVIRYGPYSLKSSPILRERQLGEFLEHLLSSDGHAIDLATIMDVVRVRFGLVSERATELSEDLAAAASAAPVAVVGNKELALSVLSRLSRSEANAIKALQETEGDVRDAAAVVGASPEMVTGALSKAMQLIADYCESIEEAREVYRALTESLF